MALEASSVEFAFSRRQWYSLFLDDHIGFQLIYKLKIGLKEHNISRSILKPNSIWASVSIFPLVTTNETPWTMRPVISG